MGKRSTRLTVRIEVPLSDNTTVLLMRGLIQVLEELSRSVDKGELMRLTNRFSSTAYNTQVYDVYGNKSVISTIYSIDDIERIGNPPKQDKASLSEENTGENKQESDEE